MIVSRRQVLAAGAAGGLLGASAARAAGLGNPDNPAQGPDAIKGNPASDSNPVSFSQRLSHLPPELVKAHFHFSDQTMRALPKDKVLVV